MLIVNQCLMCSPFLLGTRYRIDIDSSVKLTTLLKNHEDMVSYSSQLRNGIFITELQPFSFDSS